MKGFDEDEVQGESDDCGEAALGFLAAQGEALEALEFSEVWLDAGAAPVAPPAAVTSLAACQV